jgi:flavin reductase (DIM6/NTAB) family NADH-FMN oxidoreductase RutF
MESEEGLMKIATFKEAMALWSRPERLLFITSLDENARPRVMTLSWQMRASFQPPMLAVAIHEHRHMHACILGSGEFVLSVPGAELAQAVLACGLPSTKDANRFALAGLIQSPATYIKSPLVDNCVANFECKLISKLNTGDHTLFVGEVLASWINENPSKNLLTIGFEEGYQLLAEADSYRIGIIK